MTRRTAGPWRQVMLTLAVLALALKALVPAGFMAAPRTNELPFALVLCTGEGPVTVAAGGALDAAGQGHDGSAGKAGHDAPCAFAGHGQGLATPDLPAAGPAGVAVHRIAPTAPVADIAPGRGMAAPPPPNRGPPSLNT